MNNRPPQTFEVVDIDEKNELWFANGSETFRVDCRQQNAMQEALTAEWKISIGAMPDPTDFIWLEVPKAWVCVLYGFDDWNDCYEDKDPRGKPEDYKVKR